MKTENEVVETYLQNIVPPECESAGHQGRLRAELLARVERRQAGGMLRGYWKTAVLVLGLLAIAAAATEVAVQVHHYYFGGHLGDRTYLFSTFDSQGVSHPDDAGTMTVIGDGKEWDAAQIEQKRKDLEEVALLRQKNAGQLVLVSDMTVNGHPLGRVFTYTYQLASGRTETAGESYAPGEPAPSPAQEQQQLEEAQRQGRREVIGVRDIERNGQVNRTLTCRYVLADGRVVIRGAFDPDSAPAAKVLTPPQQMELVRLVWAKQGTNLGRFEATVDGQTFTFEKCGYRLSDGTVVTDAEGEPQGPKVSLSAFDADTAEFAKLRQAGAGEPLAEYTAEISGRTFLFKPVKYVLSDGTEVVWAPAQPVPIK